MWVDAPKIGAGGDINPSRFIMVDVAGGDYRAIQADAAAGAVGTNPIIGVSKESTREAPQAGADPLHAKLGEHVEFHACSPGESCLVEAGAAITRGDWLTAAADGQAVKATIGQYAYAYALESVGAADVKVRVVLVAGVVAP